MLWFRESQSQDLDKGLGMRSIVATKKDDQIQQLAIHWMERN